ncbi:MAG: glutathione S-transferase family protein [Pseudanabaenaceae cyanobacterium bins.68]|nr:glutathione S-transferase family protein [Pseudanabaenaceae cyanobacterium bins.68]
MPYSISNDAYPMLTWTELTHLAAAYQGDQTQERIHGKTNSQATLRLFGQTPADVRVTLYRDHHAWCPYCQKVWLWLEEKQIPYRIAKVTMFCYGQNEDWYKRKVPSGMLPALELDGKIITESDQILLALEQAFGSLGASLTAVTSLRQLERQVFRAWCEWLCRPQANPTQEARMQAYFSQVAEQVEQAIAATPGAYFLPEFSVVDLIFVPYLERMHASLFYYKGYPLRQHHPRLSQWFDALETRPTYRGTQSDFHTHVHDLPPQMGGCYASKDPRVASYQAQVNNGDWFGLPDVQYPEPASARLEALHRVLKHRDRLIQVNPFPHLESALRAALTHMITGEVCQPPQDSDLALRYLRDRISVPRDMSIYAAKHLRTALETTAALVGDRPTRPLPTTHRQDQDPAPFQVASQANQV